MKEPKIESPILQPDSYPRQTPEREQSRETVESAKRETIRPSKGQAAHSVQTDQPQRASPARIDPELKSIERILSEGMDAFFMSLTPDKKLEFKDKGEDTAKKIIQLVHRGKYRVQEIVSLIVTWLKTLPGINKFFLEQEAKIKADSIVRHYKK